MKSIPLGPVFIGFLVLTVLLIPTVKGASQNGRVLRADVSLLRR